MQDSPQKTEHDYQQDRDTQKLISEFAVYNPIKFFTHSVTPDNNFYNSKP